MLIKNVKSSDGLYLIKSDYVNGFKIKDVGYVSWCSPSQYWNTPSNLKTLEVNDDFNPNVDDCLGSDSFIDYDIIEPDTHETEAQKQYVYVITQTKLENKDNIFTASSRVIDVCESADKAIEIAQGFVETTITKMEVKK